MRFYWNIIFLLKITLIFIKEPNQGQFIYCIKSSFNWPDYLHKHNRNTNWSYRFFKTILLERTQGTLRLSFSQPFRAQKLSHTHLLPGFACSTCIPQVLEVPFVSWCSSLPSFRKAIFAPYLERLPWTTQPNTVPSHLSSRLLMASKVNLNFSRLSSNNQSPCMLPSGMTFQTKSWLIKSQLETGFMCPVVKKSDPFWIYTNILP